MVSNLFSQLVGSSGTTSSIPTKAEITANVNYSTASLFGGLQGAYEIVIIVFSTIATVIIAFSYLPQLITTAKTKGTTGLSFYMWLLIVIAEIGFSVWGILYLAEGSEATTATELHNLGDLNVTAKVAANGSSTVGAGYIKDYLSTVLQYAPAAIIAQAHQIAVSEGLINGLALFVCDVICGVTAAGILAYKVKNMKQAKKEGITEAELCNRMYDAIKAKKGAQ